MLKAAVEEARDDDVPMIAQALAYALFLAIPGILLVTLGAFSPSRTTRSVPGLVGRLEGVMPDEAATLLQDSLTRSAASAATGS